MAPRRVLDLFCGAGGASMGLHLAWPDAEIVGVDLVNQPHYPFRFIKADALAVDLNDYDFVWASPPCQGFTAYKRRPDHVRPRMNLIPELRTRLQSWGGAYVIENVQGAPLQAAIWLCGSSFGLDIRRHRYFECSFPLLAPPCNHGWQRPRFVQATNREHRRSTVEIGVWRIPLEVQQQAMGIDWMNLKELSEAIPPAYTEWIGRHLLESMAVPA